MKRKQLFTGLFMLFVLLSIGFSMTPFLPQLTKADEPYHCIERYRCIWSPNPNFYYHVGQENDVDCCCVNADPDYMTCW